MNDDQFTKLYKYMTGRFDSIEKKLDEKASQSSLDHLADTIDAFVKRLDNAEVEQAARDAQWNRLLEWAREVAKKTGVPMPNL